MAYFGSKSFVDKNGGIYHIDLDLSDAALMEDRVEIRVDGEYRPREGDPVKAEFKVNFIASERRIEILYEDQVVGNIELGALDLNPDDEFDEKNPEEAWARVRELLADDGATIEAIIQAVPTDPVFGCLIKAGLSTAIGQLLHCYANAREIQEFRRFIMQVLRCLGVNSLGMLYKFTVRTLKCAILGGLIPV